jgi:hypothetical protein
MEHTARARRGPEDGGRLPEEGVRGPEHVPQLHRALAGAVEDIDAVEDRLSDLFERTDGRNHERTDRRRDGRRDGQRDRLQDGRSVVAEELDPFAELDAALVAEEPDEVDRPPDRRPRRVFRRKGTD